MGLDLSFTCPATTSGCGIAPAFAPTLQVRSLLLPGQRAVYLLTCICTVFPVALRRLHRSLASLPTGVAEALADNKSGQHCGNKQHYQVEWNNDPAQATGDNLFSNADTRQKHQRK